MNMSEVIGSMIFLHLLHNHVLLKTTSFMLICADRKLRESFEWEFWFLIWFQIWSCHSFELGDAGLRPSVSRLQKDEENSGVFRWCQRLLLHLFEPLSSVQRRRYARFEENHQTGRESWRSSLQLQRQQNCLARIVLHEPVCTRCSNLQRTARTFQSYCGRGTCSSSFFHELSSSKSDLLPFSTPRGWWSDVLGFSIIRQTLFTILEGSFHFWIRFSLRKESSF